MGSGPLWLWAAFNLFVLFMLAIDLGVFHRHAHEVTFREALTWSCVWIGLALLFNAGIWAWRGPATGMEFLTGYLIEKSLSVDNIFVFVLIFTAFAVPATYQHRVLFWGILGALVMRAAMIIGGAAMLARWHWIIYVFGAFLVLTGIKMWRDRGEHVDLEKRWTVRMLRRLLPMTPSYRGSAFFVRENGALLATPLFLVLIIVELTDLIFAVDSIPAIFAVTSDPFIVYTSNVFAILGLRSLYFLLAGAVTKFHYLKPALSAILVFVGVKMLLAGTWKVPVSLSLAVILALLATAVVASLVRLRRLERESAGLVGTP